MFNSVNHCLIYLKSRGWVYKNNYNGYIILFRKPPEGTKEREAADWLNKNTRVAMINENNEYINYGR
jgi:hypothetical protein